MIVTFAFPSSAEYTGGVVVLYELANGLVRRGHEVHLIHGPRTPWRITHLDELSWFAFEPGLIHHLVDDLDDPSLPAGEVAMAHATPDRLGLHCPVIQGHGLLGGPLEREVFEVPTPKLCVADWLIDVGRSYGVPEPQLLYLPYGFHHEGFAPQIAQAERSIDLAFLHHPHPAKGLDVALAVVAELQRRRPSLSVTTFGMHPPTTPLPEGVAFHHGIDREVLLRDVYDRTKVFLQPSWFEGFGLTAVEAMLMGCALVTTDNGGSREYAEPDVTARVRPPGDVAGLADAIDGLLDDPASRTALAAGGQEAALRFDWDRTAEILEGHLVRYLADPATLQAPAGPGDGPGDRWTVAGAAGRAV